MAMCKVSFQVSIAQLSSEARGLFLSGPCIYNKTCVKRSLKNRQNKDLNDKW